MKSVAEVMHIVPEQREEFLKNVLNPSEEDKKALWSCGVRNQQYFDLHGLIFMTFEYEGHRFGEDMKALTAYLREAGHLIEKRRRDLTVAQRDTTNWWAPVRKLGSLLTETPFVGMEEDTSWQEAYLAMTDGSMSSQETDTAYDEEDWVEDFHI